jgi:hypothetical protein
LPRRERLQLPRARDVRLVQLLVELLPAVRPAAAPTTCDESLGGWEVRLGKLDGLVVLPDRVEAADEEALDLFLEVVVDVVVTGLVVTNEAPLDRGLFIF